MLDDGGFADDDDDDDAYDYSDEKDESWIEKLEQNQRQLRASNPFTTSDSNDIMDANNRREPRFRSMFFQLLKCFSLRQNLKTIGKQVPTSPASSGNGGADNIQMEDIKVIHGLRTLTMIWIIFGHTIGLVNPEMMSKYLARSIIAEGILHPSSGVLELIETGKKFKFNESVVGCVFIYKADFPT